MKDSPVTRPRFDNTVSLGHILTVAGLILPLFVWIVTKNFDQDAKMAGQDMRITSVESAVTGINRKLDDAERRSKESADDLRTGVRRLDDKLSSMLMQNYRPAAK